MARGVVAPAAKTPDLSMTSDSKVCADVRRGLDAIQRGGGTTASFTLDAASDALLAPFMTMFQFERIKSPYGAAHALLLLYAPLGVVLMVLRLLLAFAIAAVVPRVMSQERLDAVGMQSFFTVLSGTIVTVKNAHLLQKHEADVLVANHISEFDAIAVSWLTPAHILGYDFYKKMLFFRLLGDKSGLVYVPYASRNQGGAEGRDQVREIIIQKLAKKDKPLAAFPEVCALVKLWDHISGSDRIQIGVQLGESRTEWCLSLRAGRAHEWPRGAAAVSQVPLLAGEDDPAAGDPSLRWPFRTYRR